MALQSEVSKNLIDGLINLRKPPHNKLEKIKPDSKKQFLNYGSQTTINTLWSNYPEIYATSGDKITITPDNLISLQKLESLLYAKGIACLRDNFIVGEVLDYVLTNGEIRYLQVSLKFNSGITQIEVIETWSAPIGSDIPEFSFKVNYQDLMQNRQKLDILDKLKNYHGYTALQTTKIPYKIFFNNSTKLGDLEQVNKEYFELLNRDLSVLLQDSYISAPWIFIESNKTIADKITAGTEDISNRVITLPPQNSLYGNYPIQSIQGQSQSLTLIPKVDKTISLIKKFAFLKNDSSDFGTKNMHNVEAQQINSDFEDYIEHKANLREMQLIDFFKSFINSDVEKIYITGSTAWNKKYAFSPEMIQNKNVNIQMKKTEE
ncbi:hypothetical protein [Mycoplasma simbae]|uniref:hypothetical protein n=1 Tax=Mycoplasma simbae TaxID=36744 RepID=UPI0006924B0A|nr:hypothetical protein [Mycoplasma simbae]